MNLNQFFPIILDLVGGLGLFLLGMKNMSEGVQNVAGNRLRRMIGLATDNRFLAIGVGTFVTCMVQSSSVSTVMTVGLVNSGFMTLKQAIGVIFGANIGTTITGWILTLKIGKYGLPILGAAAFFFIFSRNERIRYTGMAIMGVGMVFFGLELMSSGLKPIRGMPEFVEWFSKFQADSYFGVLKCALAGCVLTMIVQSSSATLGITMGLASTGIIHFHTAAALVLGENIGTTITAYLASLGATKNAKRAAYSHAIFNVLGVLWATALFSVLVKVVISVLGHDPDTMVMKDGAETFPYIMAAIAMTHSGFNITNTLLFVPLLTPLSKLVTRLVPDSDAKEIPHLQFLDAGTVATPAIAIVQSRKGVIAMGDHVLKMLGMLQTVLESKDPQPELEKKITKREKILDNIQKEVTVFLSDVLAGRVTHDVMDRARCHLRMADEYESISDYLAKVSKMLVKLRKNNLGLSDEARNELVDLNQRVTSYIQHITQAAIDDNHDIMPQAKQEGTEINRLVKTYRKAHLERLTNNDIPALKSLIYTDTLNAFRRMRDHGFNLAEALAGEK